MLSGSLGIDSAAERPGSGKRETHVPEIGIRRNKLNPYIGLALAVALNRNHSAFHRSVAILIHQNEHLSHDYHLIDLQQRPMPVHRLRLRLHAELVAVFVLPVHGDRNRDTYPQCSAPLFTAKMKYSHERHFPLD